MPRYLSNNNSEKRTSDREDGEMSDREGSSNSRSRSGSLHTMSEPPAASPPKGGSKKRSKTPKASSRRSRDKSRSRSRSHRHHSKRDGHSRQRSRSRSKSHSRRRDSRSRSRGRHNSREDRRSSKKYGRNRTSTSRSPMSRRRRHKGDRENPREGRCLGVFGLSLYTEERQLRDIFERYGPVEELQIVYDYHTGRSRGFAFIYMRHVEDAVEAKEMAPGLEIDGHKIRVDYSITERAHTPTPGTYLGRSGGMGFRGSRRSPSPYRRRGGRGRSRSNSRSRSFSPRRY